MGVDINVLLRSATHEDMEFLQGVYASTRAEEMAVVPWTAEQKRGFLEMQFNAQRRSYQVQYPHAEYYVIQRDGLPIGRIIVDRSQQAILLMDIALLPEYRNHGIGTSLIRQLLDEGDRSGRPVQLHVEGFNPAMRLYTRLGFVKTGEVGIYFEMTRQPEGDVHG